LQIIESNETTRLEVEQSAQAEMKSYLSQRYKVNTVFTDTTVYSHSTTYYGKNLIEYTDVATFSAATVYTTNQRVTYSGYIYKSIAGSAAHAWNASEWTLICVDKQLYYAKTNQTEYNNETEYEAGDVVWYGDVVYTAISDTEGHEPTDTDYWTAGATYSFSAHYPDETAYWTMGDNRNQLIVMYLIDITLYHLHSRINPRNIPDLRSIRYDGNNATQNGGAIAWLKRVAGGELNADLPEILPVQSNSIQWGSNTKNTNGW
jgi:hypothetical protein